MWTDADALGKWLIRFFRAVVTLFNVGGGTGCEWGQGLCAVECDGRGWQTCGIRKKRKIIDRADIGRRMQDVNVVQG